MTTGDDVYFDPPAKRCGNCKHWQWGGHHGHPSECEHPEGPGDGGTIECTPGYNEPACHRYEAKP